VSKTKQRLLQSYYWVNMEKDITEHLRRCDKCQSNMVEIEKSRQKTESFRFEIESISIRADSG